MYCNIYHVFLLQKPSRLIQASNNKLLSMNSNVGCVSPGEMLLQRSDLKHSIKHGNNQGNLFPKAAHDETTICRIKFRPVVVFNIDR